MHADVASILRVGREARIHLVIATQNSGSRRMIVDADTGQARSFQSYWQYSPGTTELADAPDSAIREAWAATAQVLGTRGRTAPRVAPQVDGQEFRDLDVEELRDLAPVLLDTPTGPAPDAAQYGPSSPSWLGAAALDAGSGMDWDTGGTPPTPTTSLTPDAVPRTPAPPEPSAEGLGGARDANAPETISPLPRWRA